MTRPDKVFVISVCPVTRYHPCELAQAESERGFYCHNPRCKDCRREPDGWELWGENGHCQGSAPTRERLAHMLRHKARQQWKTRDGRLMGYRFRIGAVQSYYA